MQYGYRYHDAEGRVQCGEIAAPTREDAFVALKNRGIRPMQFWTVEAPAVPSRRFGKRGWVLIALGILCLVLGVALILNDETSASTSPSPSTSTPPSTSTSTSTPNFNSSLFASSRPRHQLAGAVPRDTLAARLAHPAERVLAAYAEPGVVTNAPAATDLDAFADDLAPALDEPLRIAADDARELIDLKRIVSGMKEEVAMRRSGGVSPEDILAWLASRQRMEAEHSASIRARVKDGRLDRETANRNLRAMGLAEIVTP